MFFGPVIINHSSAPVSEPVRARAGSAPPAASGWARHKAATNAGPPPRLLVGLVPAEVDCFQPRDESARLAAVTAGVCQVLSGLGGVGKTQLAARYARSRWDAGDVDLLVWITAASRVQIVDGYAEAAAQIGLVDHGENPERAAARLLSWLASADRPWLVVLDGLAQPGDLRKLWPPTGAGGATVITTRRRDNALTGAGRVMVDVGQFTPAEARAYLTAKLASRCTTSDGDSVAEIDGLVTDLGFLPLALAQAATYLLDRGLTCAKYRARFADRKRTLTQLVPEDGSLPDDHTTTVAATWSLSIDAADALTPAGLARPLLRLASLLSPDAIPVALFTTDEVLAWLGAQHTAAAGSPGAVSADDVIDGLSNLYRLNLATLIGDAVRVHALVQRATREATRRDLPASQMWRQLIHVAADGVVAVGNLPWQESDLTEMVWRNAYTLIGQGGDDLWIPDGHTVLYGLGESLGESGHVREAAEYFQDLARTAAERLGPTHRDTFLARTKHARWLAASGHPAAAAAELGRVIADRTRAWGADDPDNLIDLANQATNLGDAGDAKAALSAFTRLVQRRTEIDGPDHRDTLVTRGNQARWRGEAGDIPGAIRAYAELVPLFSRTFGATAARTLWVRNELAAWRGELNPAVGAAELARLLPVTTLVHGAYGAKTMTARHNLAALRDNAGQVDQAISDLTDLIADYEQHIDPDHPAALRARQHLAQVLITHRRDVPGSYRALKDLLTHQCRALGADHPAVDRTRHLLDRFEDMLGRRLSRAVTGAGAHRTTLARLAGGVGVDVDWVRDALTACVNAGTLSLTRGGPAGNAQVDLATIAEHARFEIITSA